MNKKRSLSVMLIGVLALGFVYCDNGSNNFTIRITEIQNSGISTSNVPTDFVIYAAGTQSLDRFRSRITEIQNSGISTSNVPTDFVIYAAGTQTLDRFRSRITEIQNSGISTSNVPTDFVRFAALNNILK